MCGIVGIISNENIVKNLINSLKYLEYRGYDSSGISVLNNNEIKIIKRVGKVQELENAILQENLESNIGIIHSRWATHGGVTEINAHPHISSDNFVSVVHNGIIENYIELKKKLIKKNYKFISETDTEVVPNLISYYYKETKSHKKAILKAKREIKGSFALCIIFKDDNKHLYCTRRGSPLLIGIGKNKNFVASGMSAFTGLTNQIISLQEDDFAVLTENTYDIYDKNEKKVIRQVETISIDDINVSKGGYKHYMLKEINEEPKVIIQTVKEYIDIKNKKITLPNFDFDLSKIEKINIFACGTSYYVGYIAKYFFEDIAKISINIEPASEFRYRNPIINKNDISLFISQSGETADTIGALKLCKEHGQKIISLVNVLQSNIASLSDIVLKTLAGVEVGVAATKSTIGQLVVMYILAVEFAKIKKTITNIEYKTYINELINLSDTLNAFLTTKTNLENIKKIAKKINNNIFFIPKDKKIYKENFYMFTGRDIFYPVALEGALKLKEINYTPCEGISSGELKHGPIALIDKDTYVFAINPTSRIFDKTASNIEEIVARKGKIILISDKKGIKALKNKFEYSIEIEESDNIMISAINSLLVLQLISYYIARENGRDIDKPRNLAKSVTVE